MRVVGAYRVFPITQFLPTLPLEIHCLPVLYDLFFSQEETIYCVLVVLLLNIGVENLSALLPIVVIGTRVDELRDHVDGEGDAPKDGQLVVKGKTEDGYVQHDVEVGSHDVEQGPDLLQLVRGVRRLVLHVARLLVV